MMATDKPPTVEHGNSTLQFHGFVLFLGEMLPWNRIPEKEGEERKRRERREGRMRITKVAALAKKKKFKGAFR